MMGLYLATGLIIVLFAFKRPETILEACQVVTQLDTSYPAGGDKDPTFSQFIAGAYLPVGRHLNRIVNDGGFGLLIRSIL